MMPEWPQEFTRKNHYVPAAYLKPWVGSDGKLLHTGLSLRLRARSRLMDRRATR
jgi:hypothetical protein